MSQGKKRKEPPLKIDQVAGGGLLDRRLFLKHGFALGAATTLSATGLSAVAEDGSGEVLPGKKGKQAWMLRPGEPFTNYGQPSQYEEQVIRWISTNSVVPGNGVSWSPLHELEGIITPNGLHYERHHNGVPQIDPAQHRLLIHGMVDKPLVFTIKDLMAYPMESRFCFIECGGNSNAAWNKKPVQTPVGYFHGLVSCSEWTGVPLSIILDEAGIEPEATWLIAEAADAIALNMSLPVEKAMDDVILALYQNGERVRPENGYPLRLIVPGWEGVLNVKWLRRLTAADRPQMTRNETSRYTELLPSGQARQFSFVMDAKSLITKPFMGSELRGPGLYEISGLAWTGHGQISKVEVSADGGKSWAEAALNEPVLPSSCPRRRRLQPY